MRKGWRGETPNSERFDWGGESCADTCRKLTERGRKTKQNMKGPRDQVVLGDGGRGPLPVRKREQMKEQLQKPIEANGERKRAVGGPKGGPNV